MKPLRGIIFADKEFSTDMQALTSFFIRYFSRVVISLLRRKKREKSNAMTMATIPCTKIAFGVPVLSETVPNNKLPNGNMPKKAMV